MIRFNLITSCLLSIGHARWSVMADARALTRASGAARHSRPTPNSWCSICRCQPLGLLFLIPLRSPKMRHASSTDVAYDATKILPLAREQLEGAIESMSAGVSAQLPLPAVQLPASRSPEAGVQTAAAASS